MSLTKFSIFAAIFLLYVTTTIGQTGTIDSLEMLLHKHVLTDTAKVNLLNKLAYEIRLSDPIKTKSYAKESWDLSCKLNYAKGKAASLWVSGITIIYNDKETALDHFRKALKIAEEIDDKEGQCNYLVAIGNAVKMWGNAKESDESYQKALQIALKLNDKKLILKVRINYAKSITRSGNHIEAIEQLEEVVKIAKEIDYKEVVARAYADLGLIYNTRGNFPLSTEYLFLSLEINEKRNDYIGVYDNLLNIAKTQSDQNDFDTALSTIKRAQLLATEKQDSMRMSLALNSIGNMYRRIKHPDALYFFQQSLSMSKFNKLQHNINNLVNIGSIYTEKGEFKKAMTSLNEALILTRKANVKKVYAEVNVKIGVLYLEQKQYSQAKEYILKALSFARETNFTEIQKDCHKLLSDIYAATGGFKDAYNSHVQYKLLYDSIYNEKDTRRVAILESTYQFAKEKEVYEVEKSARELRIKSQQQAILSLVVISILVCLFAGAIYWSNRLRKKILRLEIEKINQELEDNQKAMAIAKLKLIQNSERNTHNVKVLENIGKSIDKSEDTINSLINNYKIQSSQSNWEEFETLFTKVNASFWDKLNELCPTLTPNERKLCVFLKLNMSNKDIALITFQSDEALKKSRMRLRKKFNLDRSTNLVAFIQNQ